MKKVDVKESAVGRETRIRKQWNEQSIFEQSIQNREGAQSFVFYEGPPTRTVYHTSAMHLVGQLKI